MRNFYGEILRKFEIDFDEIMRNFLNNIENKLIL